MGRINKNLRIDLHKKLQALARFGQSKHEAKARYRNWLSQNCPPDGYETARMGIYSIRTMENYQQCINCFADWCKARDINRLSSVTRGLVIEYLQSRRDSGLSAWTLARDKSALNKVLFDRKPITAREAALPERRLADIMRSRNPTATDNRDYSRWARQIAFCSAFGLRRGTVTELRYDNLRYNANGQVIGLWLDRDKGGRARLVPCLTSHREAITAIVGTLGLKSSDRIFTEGIDKNFDVHALRAEYAVNLYNQLLQEQTQSLFPFGGNYYLADFTRLKNIPKCYMGYDGRVLAAVSGALGHNRLNVIVSHYLR